MLHYIVAVFYNADRTNLIETQRSVDTSTVTLKEMKIT